MCPRMKRPAAFSLASIDRIAIAMIAMAATVSLAKPSLLRAQSADLVLCDDGLQHLALVRDCEIAVIDGQRGFGNGCVLPRGPLRESPRRLRRVNAVVMNGDITAPGFELPACVKHTLFTMHLVPGEARPVAGHGALRPLASFRGLGVHAVAAIGNPRRFFDMLRGAGILHFGPALLGLLPWYYSL